MKKINPKKLICGAPTKNGVPCRAHLNYCVHREHLLWHIAKGSQGALERYNEARQFLGWPEVKDLGLKAT